MTPAPVAFDGGILAAGPLLGVAQAFLHALRAYARLTPTPALLLLPPGASDPAIDGITVLRTAAVRGPLARRFALPRLLRRHGVVVYHTPVAAIPRTRGVRIVATVHDLPWRTPDLPRETGHSWRHRRALAIARTRADVVICPSRATASDLHLDCPRPRARVEVVPHGIPLPGSPLAIEAHDGPFLALGDDRPRKNLARLAAAHARARARHPALTDLCLLGPRRARDSGLWVDEDDKHDRLARARALIQPSLHEGFGLPVLEAMGHGTPVICSDRKSLPELVGDAALLIDPSDIEAIADAMIAIDTDRTLCENLARAGRARAAEFLPEHTAGLWRRIHEELGA